MPELIETVKIYGSNRHYLRDMMDALSYAVVDKEQRLESGHIVKFSSGKTLYLVRTDDVGWTSLISVADSGGGMVEYTCRYRRAEPDRLFIVPISKMPAWLLVGTPDMPEDIKGLAERYIEEGLENRPIRELRRRRVPVGAAVEERVLKGAYEIGWNGDGHLRLRDVPVNRALGTDDLVKLRDPSVEGIYKVRNSSVRWASESQEQRILQYRLMAVACSEGRKEINAPIDLEENALNVERVPVDDLPGWLLGKVPGGELPEKYLQVAGLVTGPDTTRSYNQMVGTPQETGETVEETQRWGDSGLERLPTVELRKACMRRMGVSRNATRDMEDDEMRDALFTTGYRVSRGHLARKRSSKAREALMELATGLGWPEAGVESLETEDIKRIVRKELRYTGEPSTIEGKVLKSEIGGLSKVVEEMRNHSQALELRLRGSGSEQEAAERDRDAYKGQVDGLIEESQALRTRASEEQTARRREVEGLNARINTLESQMSAAIPRTDENAEALEIGLEVLERRRLLEEAPSGRTSAVARFQVANLLEDGND